MRHEPKFKKFYTFEKRLETSKNLLLKYPERVPVILSAGKRSDKLPIKRFKYLIPRELNLAKFVSEVRRHSELSAEESLFIFVDDFMPAMCNTMGELYSQYKDPDGFLYISCHKENTFG